jgi:hypothetical protein
MIDGYRGGVVCAGIGGQITGRPGDVIVVDDPLKNLEEAQSAKYRDRGLRTWQGTLIPRMAPHTKVFWIQTLWHEQEPIQQILANEGGDWEVIRIPAICDSPDDPLGREIGEPMQSARGVRDWAKIRPLRPVPPVGATLGGGHSVRGGHAAFDDADCGGH